MTQQQRNEMEYWKEETRKVMRRFRLSCSEAAMKYTSAPWPNGRFQVKWKEHPRANPEGYVYAHIIIAEAMQNEKYGTHRYEKPSVVYHRDGHQYNNAPENLLVVADTKNIEVKAHDGTKYINDKSKWNQVRNEMKQESNSRLDKWQ